jgi:hypothetical protein
MTWAERSVKLRDNIIKRVNEHLEVNKIPYEINKGVTSFNDRISITPITHDEEYKFISIIIGWIYADAELAVVRRFNNEVEYDLITNEYLVFYNELDKIPDNREEDDGTRNGTVKYYLEPFDEREDEIVADVITILEELFKTETKSVPGVMITPENLSKSETFYDSLTTKNKLNHLYDIDPDIVEDARYISESEAAKLFPNALTANAWSSNVWSSAEGTVIGTKFSKAKRYGNVDFLRSIIEPITDFDHNNILFNPIGILSRIKPEDPVFPLGTAPRRISRNLEICQILLSGKGYYLVEYLDMLFFASITDVTIVLKTKHNTRKERRILRRASKKLDVKATTIVYTDSKPRVYCVEKF